MFLLTDGNFPVVCCFAILAGIVVGEWMWHRPFGSLIIMLGMAGFLSGCGGVTPDPDAGAVDPGDLDLLNAYLILILLIVVSIVGTCVFWAAIIIFGNWLGDRIHDSEVERDLLLRPMPPKDPTSVEGGKASSEDQIVH